MDIKRDRTSPPIIPVATKIHPQTGELMIRVVPFKPGMTIERCGRRYVVDEKGQQRRIK